MNRTRGAYTIGVVSELLGIHPQTLRLYERRGLLQPSRSAGNTRLYSDEDLDRLRFILRLTQELGVNLAGVEVILQMRERLIVVQDERQQLISYVVELMAGDAEASREALVPTDIRKLVLLARTRSEAS